jgi:hypothetical protein
MKLVSENFLFELDWILLQSKIRFLLKQDVYIYVGHSFYETDLN